MKHAVGSSRHTALSRLVLACSGALTACSALAADQRPDAKRELTLVQAGAARATIVLAAEPTQSAQFAARELQEHVRTISGATLPLVYASTPPDGVRILVGESAGTRELGLRSADFAAQEYLVGFRPGALVLMGRDAATPAPVTRPTAKQAGQMRLSPGKFGGSTEFTEGVILVSDCGFDDRQGTLETWVYLPPPPEPAPLSETILRLDGTGVWSYHILDRVAGGRIRYVAYRAEPHAASAVHSGTLEPGWHHLLATHDAEAAMIELFVNGVSQGTANYAETTCAGATLKIGGMPPRGTQVDNTLCGRIDELRVSKSVRAPVIPDAPYELDADTTLLVHFDGEPPELLCHRDMIDYKNTPPSWYAEQGTCYAVYDFLERCCDVRWYAPGELGLVCPANPTLTVRGTDVRRRPAFLWRYSRCMSTGWGLTSALWGNPDAREVQAFARRLRYGGEAYAGNHSFYGYYERFREEDAQLFESAHPEYFATGYEGKPPQLCYTNPALVAQVVQDARASFDGKTPPKARVAGDYFALVPMDNSRYCQCEACRTLLDTAEEANEQFSNGKHSNYVFSFVNAVAKSMRTTHPGKFMAALAYANYAVHPTSVRLEPNISVQMCLTIRHCWAPLMKKTDLRVYNGWVAQEPDRRLLLWLYYCFPELSTRNQAWHCFPGFFVHTAAEWFRRFHADGIRGVGLGGGIGELVDTYVTSKMMDDPSLDIDATLEELFSRFYGAAGRPLKQMYLLIETTYCDPANYPEEVRKEDRTFHQTEEIAWGYLGTEQRMSALAALMAEAKAAAVSETQARRVALFEQAVWKYMVDGRQGYLRRRELTPLVEELKKAPLPSVRVPRIAPGSGGDVAGVDFAKGAAVGPWYTIWGFPADRKAEARVAHDGEYLYLELQDFCDPQRLLTSGGVWGGDDWELFFAGRRAKPYRQFGVNPAGKFLGTAYGEGGGPWDTGAIVQSTKHTDRWTVRIALPLSKLLRGGAAPGASVYANFIRGTHGDGASLAWSPHFRYTFHDPGKLGELILE